MVIKFLIILFFLFYMVTGLLPSRIRIDKNLDPDRGWTPCLTQMSLTVNLILTGSTAVQVSSFVKTVK